MAVLRQTKPVDILLRLIQKAMESLDTVRSSKNQGAPRTARLKFVITV